MEWWIIIGLLCILPEASVYKANYKKKKKKEPNTANGSSEQQVLQIHQ